MSVKELREQTGAGIMDCKKAFEATNGDMEKAIVYLKEKGLSRAIKRSGNTASEGAIVISNVNKTFGMIHIGTETDFVAKNDHFCNFINNELEAFLSSSEFDITNVIIKNEDFNKRLALLAATIGENIILKNQCKIIQDAGTDITTYIHSNLNADFLNIGKIGVILKTNATQNKELLKNLTLHLASFQPTVLSKAEIKEEKDIAFEEQDFLMNNALKIKQICAQNDIKILEFKVFALK